MTFFEQLCLPWLMLMPHRIFRITAGMLEIFFQLCVVGTGNYAWINFYGMLPCIALFDDDFFQFLGFGREDRKIVPPNLLVATLDRIYRWGHTCAILVLAAVIAVKSTDPIRELYSPAPWINNYDPLFIMNSQGVFGFINQHRIQPVLEYTHAKNLKTKKLDWKPLDFKCLPGSVDRTPCLMSPYHYRLDWETWIRTTASMERIIDHPDSGEIMHHNMPQFLRELMQRLLHRDDDALGLMGVPHLYDQGPPTAIRTRFYKYTFDPAKFNSWLRKPLGKSVVHVKDPKYRESRSIRRSPRQRHWIMGSAILAFTSSFWTLPQTAFIFIAALLADYKIESPSSLYMYGRVVAGMTLFGLLLPIIWVERKKNVRLAYKFIEENAFTILAFFAMTWFCAEAESTYIIN